MVPPKSITLVILGTTVVSFDREIDGYYRISLAFFQSLDESDI